ncbi:hypothetical protein [Nocardia sp. NPDC004604]
MEAAVALQAYMLSDERRQPGGVGVADWIVEAPEARRPNGARERMLE